MTQRLNPTGRPFHRPVKLADVQTALRCVVPGVAEELNKRLGPAELARDVVDVSLDVHDGTVPERRALNNGKSCGGFPHVKATHARA